MSAQRPFSLRKITLIIFIIIVLCYALFRFWAVLFGVRIVLNPTIHQDGLMTISGYAKHARLLTINGLPIPEDETGAFAFQIASLSGINRARIFAQDKFGHTDTELVEWYYNNPNPLDTQPETIVAPTVESDKENNGI